jgi:hypothetical protein
MDEFISIIQFHTAIPFGYLLFSLLWLSVVAWALKNIVSTLWSRRFRGLRIYIAGCLLVVSFGYVYASIRYSENINMNPFFQESALVGEWSYGGSKLVLKPDGIATINLSKSLLARLGIDNGDGYWRKEGDFNLVLGSAAVNFESKNGMLRVIQYAEKYRLIIEDYEDPDMWDGSLGFKQKNM